MDQRNQVVNKLNQSRKYSTFQKIKLFLTILDSFYEGFTRLMI